jgi:hypothetical protein
LDQNGHGTGLSIVKVDLEANNALKRKALMFLKRISLIYNPLKNRELGFGHVPSKVAAFWVILRFI